MYKVIGNLIIRVGDKYKLRIDEQNESRITEKMTTFCIDFSRLIFQDLKIGNMHLKEKDEEKRVEEDRA